MIADINPLERVDVEVDVDLVIPAVRVVGWLTAPHLDRHRRLEVPLAGRYQVDGPAAGGPDEPARIGRVVERPKLWTVIDVIGIALGWDA